MTLKTKKKILMTAIAPESIKLSELPSLPLEWHKALPKCAAIYIAYRFEEVLYVGRSVDLQNRWKGHHRIKQLIEVGNVRLAWIEVSNSKLLPAIETALIEYLQPRFNFAACKPRSGLTKLRNKASLRAVDVAMRLGVNESTIRNWEQGRTELKLTIEQYSILLEIFDCTWKQLGDAYRTSELDPQNPPSLSEI